MANNQKKLKAFVRYDGSGRVVASSLILRKNKPRVGRWYEIPEYLCCNGTTNTTTTQGGGGTPTAWIGRMTTDLLSVCESGSNLWFTAGPVIDGQIVYQDASLTNPYTENGLLISTAGYYYQLNEVGLATLLGPCPEPTTTSTTSTTTTAFVGTYYVADTSAEVCGGTGLYSLPLIVDPNACSNGGITLAVGTYPDYGIVNGSTIYINLQNGSVIQVQTSGSSQMSFGCTSCG